MSTYGKRDEYVAVLAVLRGYTNKAVRLQVKDAESAWIPRSCIHGGDDRELDRLELDQEISIRIMEWVAQKRRMDLLAKIVPTGGSPCQAIHPGPRKRAHTSICSGGG